MSATVSPWDTPAPSSVPAPALVYDGRVGELYPIFLRNLLFTILTLGVYRFWAITNYRRYFWSRLAFQGQRLEYIGTGREMFLGFLLALLFMLPFVAGFFALSWLEKNLHPLVTGVLFFVLYLVFAIFSLAARYAAQRYRLSRTLWRGIRGGMTGSAFAYGVRALGYWVLAGLTLSLLVPWVQVRLARRRINAAMFGSASFSCTARAGGLFGRWLLLVFGTLLLLGLLMGALFFKFGPQIAIVMEGFQRKNIVDNDPRMIILLRLALPYLIAGYVLFAILSSALACWYYATLIRTVAGASAIAGVRFANTTTGRGFLWLFLGNLLVMLFTIGLGYPVALQRGMRFVAGNLTCTGAIDPQALRQSELAPPRTGEGLFQLLDSGGGVI